MWISCLREGETRTVTPAASHDEIHHQLDDVLDRHAQDGQRVRNVLRGGEPAWDVLDPAGAVHATYWVSRGSSGVPA
jgi:hypothetical protein